MTRCDIIKLTDKCDICGKNLLLTDSLTCSQCGKEICPGHPSEQYKRYSSSGFGKYSSSNVSYNYPDGESLEKDEFFCYRCRTGKKPQNTSKPKSFWLSTKTGIIFLVIIMLILSAGVWYSYNFFTKDIYFETEGFSGKKTTETFTIESEGEIKLVKYSPEDDAPSLTVDVYKSDSDELVSRLTLDVSNSGKAGKSYSLHGDDIIPEGDYYLVIKNSSGRYKIQVMEEII